MKAAQFRDYGGPEVIEINEIPQPTPAQDQVLIEVYAATINPFDYKVRRGYMKDSMPLKLPLTIGGNFSGIVVGAESEVTKFKVGDKVFGQSYAFGGGSGAIAEYAVASVENIAIKPKNISYIEAGSLPLVGASAIQALEQHINLKDGQKILIHGGAGGIGSIAIQLAKYLGAYIVTTVSGEEAEFVKSLGADEVIDYQKEKFEENPPAGGFDAVFDTVGGDTLDRSFKVLKKGGVLVSMLGEPSKELALKYEVAVFGQNTQTNSKNLSRLKELVEQGVIKPQIDRVFPLDQTREAFEYVETGHPRGKVVISIKE
ncbi:NADP-dependent oxidoreductase [Candidatus Daviesbacteria bacterium]|nr:NADP-dependent oxidoreductase [Candidatus Daviesbacteria bacterium]